MGLVLITHDMGVVLHAATRVMVMYAGQVIELGNAQAVFEHPAHPYTSALMECLPTMAGPDPRHTRLRAIAGNPPDLTDPPSGCRFAERCPVGGAGEPCYESTSPIPLREHAPGHFVRTLTGANHG
jgi:oligopeptide/dipeptide ABC transporter ATP-binding protein